jgi:hypothetical protein
LIENGIQIQGRDRLLNIDAVYEPFLDGMEFGSRIGGSNGDVRIFMKLPDDFAAGPAGTDNQNMHGFSSLNNPCN